jgi:hypothetical protein
MATVPVTPAYKAHAGAAHAQLWSGSWKPTAPQASVAAREPAAQASDWAVLFTKHSFGMAASAYALLGHTCGNMVIFKAKASI